MSLRTAIALFIIILFVGCSMEVDLSLDRNGTGHGEAAVTIHPAVERYVDAIFKAVGAQLEGPSTIPLIDVAMIEAELERAPGIKPVEVVAVDRRHVIVRFEITDIELALGGSVELEASANDVVAKATIDRTSFTSISRLFFDESSPLAAFIPVVPTDFLTEAEYREIVAYVLEDFMIDSTVDEMIDSSSVDIALRPDGTVVDVAGGLIDEKSAWFTIPTISMVTLESPIHLEAHWR